MPKLTPQDKNFINLILRSPDIGDGWRNSSNTLWPIVQGMAEDQPELFELGEKTIRLTPVARILMEYI